jgi:signal transduction histidine kinase
LPRVFDRFYRVDPGGTGEHNGIGLGLSICKSIIQGLNGSIDVDSTVGKGSTLCVTLPIA